MKFNNSEVVGMAAIPSFVSLQMSPAWAELGALGGRHAFFLSDVSARSPIATLVAFVILASLVGVIVIGLKNLPGDMGQRLTAGLLLASLVNPATFNGYPWFDRSWILWLQDVWPWGLVGAAAAIVVAAALLFCVGCIWHRRVLSGGLSILALMSPLAVYHIGHAGWLALTMPSTGKDHEIHSIEALPESTTAHPRVVWIILDELDETVLFERRPDWLKLPALDRFRNQAATSRSAVAAAKHTILAVPAMTTGRIVESATPLGADRLELTFSDGSAAAEWSSARTLFSMLAERGVRQGVVGWYIPYCRLFGRSLSWCRTEFLGTMVTNSRASLPAMVGANLRAVDPLFRRRNAVAAVRRLVAHARSAVSAETLEFVFVHIPLPHQPTVFEVDTGEFTSMNFSRTGYFHNVAAADLVLDQLETDMRGADLWDRTAVLVTSDHPWRGRPVIQRAAASTRIPFVLKLPNQDTSHELQEPVRAIWIRDLIVALVAGEITDHHDLREWLRQRRPREPTRTG